LEFFSERMDGKGGPVYGVGAVSELKRHPVYHPPLGDLDRQVYTLNPLNAQLNYVDTPKQELREFFGRFQSGLIARTQILADFVRTDERFASWTPDLTAASLEPLGAWFMSNVQTRPCTEAEMFAMASKLAYASEVSKSTLTDQTYSIAADIGIYFARVLMRLHPHLQWQLPLGSKHFVDYGQPVLRGFPTGALLNPVRISTNVAYGIASGMPCASRLRELVDRWSSHAEAPHTGSQGQGS